MSVKMKPPSGGEGGSVDPCSARAAKRSLDTPKPPAAQGQLGWSPHNESTGIRIVQSRDGSRLSIETWTFADGRWRLSGVAPSFAAVLIDAVVAALHQARDARAGGG